MAFSPPSSPNFSTKSHHWCNLEKCTNTPQNLGVCFIPCLAPLVLQQTTWDLFLKTPQVSTGQVPENDLGGRILP